MKVITLALLLSSLLPAQTFGLNLEPGVTVSGFGTYGSSPAIILMFPGRPTPFCTLTDSPGNFWSLRAVYALETRLCAMDCSLFDVNGPIFEQVGSITQLDWNSMWPKFEMIMGLGGHALKYLTKFGCLTEPWPHLMFVVLTLN